MANIWKPTLIPNRLIKDADWEECNDNIILDAFKPSMLVCEGRQRMGVSQLIGNLDDPSLHIHRDSALSPPFKDAIDLPSDMKVVIDINKKVSAADLEAFRERRLPAVKAIKHAIIDEAKAWYIDSPTAIRKEACVIDVPLWS